MAALAPSETGEMVLSGDEAGSSACSLLDGWARDADGGQLLVLLQRYSVPCAGRRLLAGLERSANEAALELFSTALCGALQPHCCQSFHAGRTWSFAVFCNLKIVRTFAKK